MNIIVTCIFLAAFAVNSVLLGIYNMNMFQLNSYKTNVHMNWIKRNILELLSRTMAAVVTVPLSYGTSLTFRCSIAALYIISSYFNRPQKMKKPLVYTPRVKRMFATLFVLAVIIAGGAFVWGGIHYSIIACAIFTFFSPIWPVIANFINSPIEKSVNNWYVNDAKRIIESMPNLIVIGVTGSYGKTSTKFAVTKLLSAKYNVICTPESYNTTMGVVKTIRNDLKATHEIFVCEMGAKNIGDIKEICDIVKPRYGIITSIGPQHLESFKTIENVISTKFELIDSLPKDGIAFLNYDNEYIRNKDVDVKTVSYAIENDADYKVKDISCSQKGSDFVINTNDGEYQFNTKLIGAHNVQNIAGAIAISNTLGISMNDIAPQTRRLESVPHRLQLIKGASALIIDDAYNSNPAGAKAALDTLKTFDGIKVLVTPGMVELGEKQYELNRVFGAQAANVCDYVALIGRKQAEPLKEGLISAGFDSEKIKIADSLNEGLQWVESIKTYGEQKVVLLENDLPDNFL